MAIGVRQDGMFLTNAIQVAKEQAINMDQVMYIVREGSGFQVYSFDAASDAMVVVATVHPENNEDFPTTLLWIRRPDQIDGHLW